MCEKNPLLLTPTTITRKKYENPKGRPKTVSKVYSSQPKSVVSQILTKMKKNGKITLPIVEMEDNNFISNYIPESDHYDAESSVTSKPKNNCKDQIKPRLFLCDHSHCSHRSKLYCNLLKHKRTHSSEKHYLCDQCSFRTNFSNSLRVHQRLHTSERPYQCSSCSYKCNSSSNLKKHRLSKHKFHTAQET